MSKRHTVSIRDKVYVELLEHGKFGESFSDVINRLLISSATSMHDEDDHQSANNKRGLSQN
ncbi:MAG: antitoxin VapB family protein [Nitrososphaeraceae archaeon]